MTEFELFDAILATEDDLLALQRQAGIAADSAFNSIAHARRLMDTQGDSLDREKLDDLLSIVQDMRATSTRLRALRARRAAA